MCTALSASGFAIWLQQMQLNQHLLQRRICAHRTKRNWKTLICTHGNKRVVAWGIIWYQYWCQKKVEYFQHNCSEPWTLNLMSFIPSGQALLLHLAFIPFYESGENCHSLNNLSDRTLLSTILANAFFKYPIKFEYHQDARCWIMNLDSIVNRTERKMERMINKEDRFVDKYSKLG